MYNPLLPSAMQGESRLLLVTALLSVGSLRPNGERLHRALRLFSCGAYTASRFGVRSVGSLGRCRPAQVRFRQKDEAASYPRLALSNFLTRVHAPRSRRTKEVPRSGQERLSLNPCALTDEHVLPPVSLAVICFVT